MHSQTVVSVAPGNNNTPIVQVTYTIGTANVVQNSSATAMTNTDGPVFLSSIRINDGGTIKDLDIVNSFGATIQNNNIPNSTTGVGVFENGTLISSSDVGFEDALVNSSTSTDILDYVYFDFLNASVPGPEFDIIYDFPLAAEDYLVVMERFGNSIFTLVPLDTGGNVIAGANVLQFGLDYDWNTGYAATSYINSQSFWFTVASIDKFFEGTVVPIANRLVYGYRIDNISEADVKFFGTSDNFFENNLCILENPSVDLVTPGSDCSSLDLSVAITGIQNANRWGISRANATIYDGAEYADATDFSGINLVVDNLPPNVSFIIRLFNQSELCFNDYEFTTPAATDYATAAASPDQTVCSSSPTVTLAGAIGGDAVSSTWNGGNGVFSPDRASLNLTYTPTTAEINNDSVTLTLITNDPAGPCPSAMDDVIITYTNAPLLTTSNTTVCEGSTVNLNTLVTDASSGTISFHTSQEAANSGADPISASQMPPNNATTTFYVRSVPVGGSTTCFATATIQISAVDIPDVAADDATICEGASIDLSTLVTTADNGVLTYHATQADADAGDNSIGSTVSPSMGTNVYYVRSTATANDLNCYGITPVEILVYENPDVTLEDLTVCEGDPFQFVATAMAQGGGVLTYQWQDNNAGFFQDLPLEQAPTLAFTEASLAQNGLVYRVIVTETTNEFGCTAEKEVMVTVNSAVTVEAGPDQTICTVDNVQLAAIPNGAGSWSGGLGSFVNDQDPNTIYLPNTLEVGAKITLIWTTTDPDGAGPCSEVSDQVNITILKVDCGAFPWGGN